MRQLLKTKAAMKKPQSKRKLNNEGMSLVEVIISITILSVVVVPVMHALTSAAYYNLRARNRQNVTFVAESLMETFKGYDIFDSENQLKSTTTPEGDTHIEAQDTLEWLFSDDGKSNLAGKIGAEEIGEVKSNIGSIRGNLINAGSNDVVFNITDMKAEDGKVYDVEITAHPEGTQEIFEIDNFSRKTDAIFVGPLHEDDNQVITYIRNDFLENHCQPVGSTSTGGDAGGGSGAGTTDDFMKAMQKVDVRGDELTTDDIADGLKDEYIKVKKRELTYIVNSATDVKCEIKYTYSIDKIDYLKLNESESSVTPPSSSTAEGEGGIEREPDSDVEADQAYTLVEGAEVADLGADVTGVDFTGFSMIESKPYDDGMGDLEPTEGNDMFDKLYIYYYPAYSYLNTIWSDCDPESIEIKVESGAVSDPDAIIDFYLIKQKIADSAVALDYEGEDLEYKPTVSAEILATLAKANLYHNLSDNIYGNRPHDLVSPSGFTEAKGYNDAQLTKKKKVLVYTVTIVISDKAGNKVSEITGSMNEKLVSTGKGTGAGTGTP